MKKAVFISIVVAAVLLAVFWYIDTAIFNFLQRDLQEIARLASELKTVDSAKEVLTPPPLRVAKEIPESFLTYAGIVRETNHARVAAGLKALSGSPELSRAAVLKLHDMFSRGYFAHETPTGENVDFFVNQSGYEYVVAGENLALGDFENDAALVKAWMESSGHRANILNPRYQEIGVAAGKGEFEGRTTWLAVQIFALPRSACPQPDASIRASIANYEEKLGAWRDMIESLRQEVVRDFESPRFEYQKKVEAYNNLVNEYNALIPLLQNLIDQYNAQVHASNACISGSAP